MLDIVGPYFSLNYCMNFTVSNFLVTCFREFTNIFQACMYMCVSVFICANVRKLHMLIYDEKSFRFKNKTMYCYKYLYVVVLR